MTVSTNGRGLYEITREVALRLTPQMNGLLHLFIMHTSCSLIIQENADLSAKRDLEEFFLRLAPDDRGWHEHTLEGVDDTTSHMKAALTQTSLLIPVQKGQLQLGTWQGIYLFEHRMAAHSRHIQLNLVESKIL